MDERELFRELRARAQQDCPRYDELYAPLLDEELRQSEESLGFNLPGFVRRLYSEVGNGGFGPGYGGVLGLLGGSTDESNLNAVERHRGWLDWQPDLEGYDLEPGDIVVPFVWPDRVLAICHWGCAIYSCIDCNSEDVPVLRLRCDCYHPTEAITEFMKPEAPTLAAWLETWLRGELKG